MEDPTTLAINLTYFGTLGLAVLMFLGLVVVVIITLVIAGVGRLLSIILLAMVGIFPKKANTPIVHLPQHPSRAPDPEAAAQNLVQPAEAEPAFLSAGPAAQAGVPETSGAVVAEPAAAPKRDLLGGARRRLAGASSALKDGAWKAKVDPRNLPKPAEVKSVVEHQTAHHPIVVAAAKEPPVLAKDWADAVAEADKREAARAKAQQPPAIKVTVRDLGEPTASSNGKTPAPKHPGSQPQRPDHGAAQLADTKSGASGKGTPPSNGTKKPGPNTSKNGKSPSPIRKGSLSGASRDS